MAPKAVLVGLPGSGKSTIGRRLAKALGVEMLDTDAAIERRTGRKIADIFAADGERSSAASKSRWCARRWPNTTASSRWAAAP